RRPSTAPPKHSAVRHSVTSAVGPQRRRGAAPSGGSARSRAASARFSAVLGEIGARHDLMDLEDVGSSEHLLGGPVAVGLREGGALRPGDEVLEAAPPGLHLVVSFLARVLDPRARLVVELHGAGAMHLVADEARGAIDQVSALAKALLEVDLVSSSDGNAIRDDDHGRRLAPRDAAAPGRARCRTGLPRTHGRFTTRTSRAAGRGPPAARRSATPPRPRPSPRGTRRRPAPGAPRSADPRGSDRKRRGRPCACTSRGAWTRAPRRTARGPPRRAGPPDRRAAGRRRRTPPTARPPWRAARARGSGPGSNRPGGGRGTGRRPGPPRWRPDRGRTADARARRRSRSCR